MRPDVEDCLTGPVPDEEDLRSLVRSNPLPVALLRLEDRRVVEVSDAFASLLGGAPERVVQHDITDFLVDAERARARVALLASGGMDSYRVLRNGLRRLDGRELLVDACVASVTDEQRRFAIAVVMPAADLPHLVSSERQVLGDVGARAGHAALGRADVVVLGTVDGDWHIDRVSADIEQLLGYDAADVIGRPLSALVAAGDLPGLLIALGHGMQTTGGASLRLQLKDAKDQWRTVRALITPLASQSAPALGFAFALTEVACRTGGDRTDELQGHLQRIAREVASAGMLAGLLGTPSATSVPAMAGLTWREMEIVTGLMAGERVSMIARRLFLSPSTVRNHLTSVYRKLGVTSQQELLALLREGDPTGG